LIVDMRRNRERMIREQLEARGITDPRVLSAMRKIPRHLYVQEALRLQAYEDHPLPIGYGQTISQPYIVAYMSEQLETAPGMSVLEIGTGSGYQATVLAEMGLDVYSVERLRELHFATQKLLRELKYYHIRLKLDDGTMGWPEMGPFDRIIVTAGGPTIPEPLVHQLADPGMLLIPVGKNKRMQQLVRICKQDGDVTLERLCGVQFVDLVGTHGW